jgi:hypothetical protein
MKKKVLATVFVVGLLLPINAHAFFGTMISGMTQVAVAMVNGGVSVANNGIDAGESVTNNGIDAGSDAFGDMVDLTSKLADDIGKMSLQIGVMADRIVNTEQMMAGLVRDLANKAPARQSVSLNSITLDIDYGTVASLNEAPSMAISNGATEYTLYVSTSIMIDSDTNAGIAISQNVDFSDVWADVIASTNANKIYIAVKTPQSTISNVVLINLQ